MKTTNKNFIYNLIYQIFAFVIPLITTPYISRVLGVENIGIYSYTYSIVNYFMLAILLGINNYGAREIAKSTTREERSKKFLSIYYLQLINSIVCILIFLLFVIFSNVEYKQILIIQTIFLISAMLDINWFYFGMEKFKITISRSMIIKLLSLIFIFILVKKETDLWIYILVLSLSTLISQLYLWIFIKKDVTLVKVSFKDIYLNYKPCIILFIPVIAYSIYRVMDKTMIGYFSDTIQLGNYESAEKIINIPLSIITALGTVMLPHMSKVSTKEYSEKIKDTYKLCFFMIFPICAGLLLVSKNFCNIFFGNGFDITPNLINLLIITVLFSCITNITRNNYLIPKSKDNIYVKSTICGAIVNFIFNLLFIPKYGAYGACFGTILAELVVMIYQIICTRIDIKYIDNLKAILPFFIKSIIMSIVILVLSYFINNNYAKIILQIIIGGIVYFALNINYVRYDFLAISKKNKI